MISDAEEVLKNRLAPTIKSAKKQQCNNNCKLRPVTAKVIAKCLAFFLAKYFLLNPFDRHTRLQLTHPTNMLNRA